MVEWLRQFKRQWRMARGSRLFRRMCRTRDPLKRWQVRMVLEQQVIPEHELGWGRLGLEILKALACEVRQASVPAHLEERFGACLVDFAVAYPGKVPNNLPARELACFAEREAHKLRLRCRN
jgi:hypothetical protein